MPHTGNSMALIYRAINTNSHSSLAESYKLLGIGPYDDVDKTHRRLAAQYHPDKFDSVEAKQNAAARFVEINKAYDAIKQDQIMRVIADRGLDKLSPVIDFIKPETRELVRQKMRSLPQSKQGLSGALYSSGLITVSSQVQLMRKSNLGKNYWNFERDFYVAQENSQVELDVDRHPEMEAWLCLSYEATQVAPIAWLKNLLHLSNDAILILLEAFNSAKLPLDEACSIYVDLDNSSAFEFTASIRHLVEAEIATRENIEALYMARPHCQDMSNGLIGLKSAKLLTTENRAKLTEVKEHACGVGRGIELLHKMLVDEGLDIIPTVYLSYSLKIILKTSHNFSSNELKLKAIAIPSEELVFLQTSAMGLADKAKKIMLLLGCNEEIKEECPEIELTEFIRSFQTVRENPVEVAPILLSQPFLDRLLSCAPYAGAVCNTLAELIDWQYFARESFINENIINKLFHYAKYLQLDTQKNSSVINISFFLFRLRGDSVLEDTEVMTKYYLNESLEMMHLAEILNKKTITATLNSKSLNNLFCCETTEILEEKNCRELMSIKCFSELMNEINFDELTKENPISMRKVVNLCWALMQNSLPLKESLLRALPLGEKNCEKLILELESGNISFFAVANASHSFTKS